MKRNRFWGAASLACFGFTLLVAVAARSADDLHGWEIRTPRAELRPVFAYAESAGPDHAPAWQIETSASKADHGWLQKSFPVTGGGWYRFSIARRTENVAEPRRSNPVRIVWLNAHGGAVPADPPPGREDEPGALPLAEPEHPLDGATHAGWTEVAGIYRAPAHATQAVVELHLQWAPHGRAWWSRPVWEAASPPAARKVRLAAIHYMPRGKSPEANCREYAPLVAKAAQQRADLVVLGETVPYVGLGKKPHETAEAVPGPTTDYFSRLCREHGVHLVVSLYEREEKVVYNTAVLLDPQGSLIGKYRKVCLPHAEIEAGVTPGDDYPVFETKLGKIGMMICYDGFFPEVARELTNRGAEVIAWPVWGCNPLLAKARACENHVYVVSSTYSDVKRSWMLSAVFDHAGEILTAAQEWGDVAVAEVDLSQKHFWRNNLGDFHNMAQRHRPTAPHEVWKPRPATESPAAERTLPASDADQPLPVPSTHSRR